ncbi:alpha/beta hydrolase family protein [Dactylosporangium sp. AC04546]|uniref:alpha/beta hydrolase n=1 Tax=Dactylosporangium sp. AC04546 TaxID=2862460 RepID=UPI001EDDC583|nr:alpha/beta hydrolase family protein [Dactylosporangium sp. AC04546]WVK86233.1 alpha/beta hydrolase family protein [Dactylosporangium sp. AC04546]
MALLRCDFFSDVLGFGTSMTVLLPDAGTDFPTLYLLHGLTDDDTAWTRNTSVERYAADLGIAVVMPQAHRSFYTDEVWGRPYWTFVSEELPRTARRLFRLSDRRADNFVAGLSMGGYGAMKLALRHPERFAAVASLSGALDLVGRMSDGCPPGDPRMWERIFGDPAGVAGTGDDLLHLVRTVGDPPAMYVACGTEDPLYPGNLAFRDACGAPLTTDFGPGAHDWVYWDARIRDVLAWLPLPSR